MEKEQFKENDVVYTTDGGNTLTQIQIYNEDITVVTIPRFTPSGKTIKRIGVDDMPVACYSAAFGVDLFIPDTVESIAAAAFRYNESIKRIIISDSVKNIGANAFRFSDIEEVNWPDSCDTIPEGCFMCTDRLKKFKGGKSLKHINKMAFSASHIREIDLSETCVEHIPPLHLFFSDVKIIPPYYFSGFIDVSDGISKIFIDD